MYLDPIAQLEYEIGVQRDQVRSKMHRTILTVVERGAGSIIVQIVGMKSHGYFSQEIVPENLRSLLQPGVSFFAKVDFSNYKDLHSVAVPIVVEQFEDLCSIDPDDGLEPI